MDAMLTAAVVNGLFQLFEAGMERGAIIDRVSGVPADKIPAILDAMYIESQQARDKAIRDAP